MSADAVLSAMSPARHCRHSGLSIPECSCRSCHIEQLRRYAPRLAKGGSRPIFDLQAPIIPLERYARELGVSVAQLKQDAQRREVEL
jgi:hypothetical protein